MADVSQLEINGTTYDICDATARDSLSNYLLKSGGTMTGSLVIRPGSIYINHSDNVDRDGAAPVSEELKGLYIRDKDDKAMGVVQSIIRTDGRSDLGFYAWNEPNGGSSTGSANTFQIRVEKDGTQSYYVSAPAAFREAIGGVPYTINGTTTSQSALSNVRFSSQSNTNQVIRMYADSYDGTYALCINKTNPFLYDSTNSTTLYSCLTNAMSESTIRGYAGFPDYLQTWTTVTGANWITPAAGWTIESDTAIRVNTVLKIAHVYYHATRTTGNSSAQNETIGTLKSAYAGQNGSCFGSFTSATQGYYLSGTTTLKANLIANTKTVYCAGLYKLA